MRTAFPKPLTPVVQAYAFSVGNPVLTVGESAKFPVF